MEETRSSPFSTASAVGLAVAALGFGWFLSRVPEVAAGTALEHASDWIPTLGIELAFRVDGLAMLFALLITGIGALVIVYAAAYFRGNRDEPRLQWLLLAFMLSMLGLVTADDVLLLFVFWELTTVTSFLLVGFDHAREDARRSALQALLVTGGGGLALLTGLILLGDTAGSYRLSEIVAAGDALVEHERYPLILALVLLGAFTKSAQVPFHFWLPNAMAAPSPVSAYLHSATMVKAGVYLLARLHPALGGTEAWFHTLSAVGAVTAVWSSLMALRQTDLKLMLAWTTVMGLGTITLFLASDVEIGILAAITFLLVHALYKCALFLAVGSVDHESGTRDLPRLGGLWRAMPMTTLVTAAAAFSMAGFPPFLGFIGKELKYEGALAVAEEPLAFAAASVAANAMMAAVALSLLFRAFFGRRGDLPREPHEAPVAMWAGPLLLSAAGLVAGLYPDLLAKTLIAPAVSSVLGEPATAKLALWHGFNLPLTMSVVTVLIGALLFWRLVAVRDALERLVAALPATAEDAYHGSLSGVQRAARVLTDRVQNGSLGHYLSVVFTVFVASVLVTLLAEGLPLRIAAATPVPALAALVMALMAAASVVVVFSRSRLLAICALGVVGSGVALLFLLFGAIDVAITQLMVETLFVVLIATVLLKLPSFAGDAHPGTATKLRDATLAIGSGVVMALLTMAVASESFDLSVTRYYESASLAEAYGANIVNVILVDFRALDTLGEIAVVATAALAVIALLKVRPHDAAENP